ncbi:MAG TPA: type 1 glutamine amidotransferase domain-containing protein [Terriglobales bacterium]|nr:type 1 glutamine amidotransferase domain-containing protein [Terriglobales bacterium]
MPERNLDGMRVAILVSTNFEQVELEEPMEALAQAGADCRIVSPTQGKITGMKHDEKKDNFNVDFTLDQVNPDQFDAVMIPGGALNSDFLRVIPKAQDFVKKVNSAGKPMAIICHGPWLLVSAGLVKGRTLTSYHTIQDDIRNAGGNWVDREVVRDGNWVTSRQPSDLQAFNREMVNVFSELRQPVNRAA